MTLKELVALCGALVPADRPKIDRAKAIIERGLIHRNRRGFVVDGSKNDRHVVLIELVNGVQVASCSCDDFAFRSEQSPRAYRCKHVWSAALVVMMARVDERPSKAAERSNVRPIRADVHGCTCPIGKHYASDECVVHGERVA